MKDELAPIILANAEAASFVDLALVPGDPPRLWIDLITSIVMAPDPRTYRLVQDGQSGRQTLLETADRQEMIDKVKQHIAHRLVAREREKRGVAAAKPRRCRPLDRCGHFRLAVGLFHRRAQPFRGRNPYFPTLRVNQRSASLYSEIPFDFKVPRRAVS